MAYSHTTIDLAVDLMIENDWLESDSALSIAANALNFKQMKNQKNEKVEAKDLSQTGLDLAFNKPKTAKGKLSDEAKKKVRLGSAESMASRMKTAIRTVPVYPEIDSNEGDKLKDSLYDTIDKWLANIVNEK